MTEHASVSRASQAATAMLADLSRMTAARLPPAALLRYKLRYALLRYSFAEALRYALQR